MDPSFRTTTPPPSVLHTPTTPKHGWEDSYQPYSPRKSARVSSQRSRVAQTPQHNLQATLQSPSSSISSVASTSTSGATFSPSARMGSTKKAYKSSPTMTTRQVSGALSYDSTVSAASALGLQAPKSKSKIEAQEAMVGCNTTMLPTPVKTPTEKPTRVASGIKSVARNLFPIRGEAAEDAMPTPKKGRKKQGRFSLGSPEPEDAPISIYTDSHDRIPEVDLSADNPFYGESSIPEPEPTKRFSRRRRMITIPGEGEQTIEEAQRREDGLIYTFRGRKIFRKFTEKDEADGYATDGSEARIDAQLAADLPDNLRAPLNRSSIKPRFLFPTEEQIKAKEMRSQSIEDEEEAMTDIEATDVMSTPKGQMNGLATTPQAPRFGPVSPPATARVTRSKQLDLTSSPTEPDRERSHSPFMGWAAGKKRGGDTLKKRGGGKKARGY